MNITDKRTKIITTIGPSSESIDVMRQLFKAGMTTIRLNFSHGDHAEQMARVVTVRKLSKELKLPISIMLDTKGPEIRVGKMLEDRQPFTAKQAVTIYTTPEEYKNRISKSGELTLSYDLSKDIKVGRPILLDDGKLEVTVTEVKPGIIKGIARNAHVLKTNKRVNLPGTLFKMPFLAEKDKNDIRLAATEKMDYIAASFVNTAKDVSEVRKLLTVEKTPHIKVISKIESQYAVDNFDEILAASDGIMVARGDLGLEIPYYDVPVVQKMIIRKCRAAGKPVIVATQMLDSMENNPHPTRAEVSDVYLATELGADATMLSGESAAGKYPVEAVEVMSAINIRAEREFYNKLYYTQYIETLPKSKPGSREDKAHQVAIKAKDGNYRFAVILSRTGQLLSAVASYRPNLNILGVSHDPLQYTAHGITSSIFMYYDVTAFDRIKANKKVALEVVKHYGGVAGDKYLVVENDKITEFVV